ncbi:MULTISPECIES: TetR/AcrR family transcriptional regulator [Chryseobacterium]|uniref:HTH-type transcriptional repressor NicS n=1 Tax=Chryseobacterium salivictor TaxID=2547600 RepID=A0A4P6ZI35_9FLAO|nr:MULTISPECIES: TetR/AcrR family transcriptional regulator [Chryseobacterium]MDQ0475830.1 AcrR family transcriptional regulator [Chryseobacterium sp. MDT2-18]QBO59258.1 HTH-type transcriptional repressor NicS [Chryseobacterium salivictor]
MISKEEHILLHAEKLFAEKGFEGSSTREISKKAKVNVSMISYYFGSKEKLFVKIFEVRMNESLTFSKDILANDNLNEWEKLVTVINRYADRVKTLKTFYRILQREQLSNKNPHIAEFLKESKKGFLAIYSELIEKGLEKKIFTKRPRIEFLHSTVSGTIFTALNTLPVYKEFFEGDENYENQYFDEIKIHVQNILKHLLGYEENI